MSPVEVRKLTMQNRKTDFPSIRALEQNASPLFSNVRQQELIQTIQVRLCLLGAHTGAQF